MLGKSCEHFLLLECREHCYEQIQDVYQWINYDVHTGAKVLITLRQLPPYLYTGNTVPRWVLGKKPFVLQVLFKIGLNLH